MKCEGQIPTPRYRNNNRSFISRDLPYSNLCKTNCGLTKWTKLFCTFTNERKALNSKTLGAVSTFQ